MTATFKIDNYDLEQFVRESSNFGMERYGFVVTPNVDHLIRFHDEERFRFLYSQASYVVLDSRLLSYMFLLFKGVRPRVCTGSDLTEQLFSKVIGPNDEIVLIGGDVTQARFLAAHYGLKQLRHFNPPMGFIHDPLAVEECLDFVERNSPYRFCLLAVGAPQQEILAERLRARGIARGLTLCVGASINFLTGVERRAPRWMQKIGMEWLFRVACDPKRLARRYLIRGPRVFGMLRRTHIVLKPPLMSTAKPIPPSDAIRARLSI